MNDEELRRDIAEEDEVRRLLHRPLSPSIPSFGTVAQRAQRRASATTRVLVAVAAVAVFAVLAVSIVRPPTPLPVASSPSPTASPSSAVAPSPTRAPFTPPVQGLAVPGVVTRATQLPAEFHLILLDEFDEPRQVLKARLVALDLSGANAHVELASFEIPTRVASAGWSASADGRRIAVVAAGSTGLNAALYLIDVPRGTVRKLLEDPDITPAAPVLSPDGTRIAVLELPRQNTASYQVQLGVFAGDTDRPETWKRIVEQTKPQGTDAASTIQPIGWSSDAQWFAYARTFVGGEIFVVPTQGGAEIKAGDGFNARWHPREPRLVLFGAGYANAPALTTFDVRTKSSRVLVTGSAGEPPQRFIGAAWHPSGEPIAFALGDPFSSTPSSMAVSTIRSDGSGLTPIANGDSNLQWSKDGRALYAWGWSTQSAREFRVTDLLTGHVVARGCATGPITTNPCP